MKKIIIGILAIMLLFLAACAVQTEEAAPTDIQPAEEVQDESPAVEAPITETPAEEIAEEAAEEVPAEESAEEASGETPAETIAPVEESALPEGQFVVKEGGTISYLGKTIVVEDISNFGTSATLFVGGIRFTMMGTRSPEIINMVEYEIIGNDFSKSGTITLSITEITLGDNEYFAERQKSFSIGSATVQLGDVIPDQTNVASAYVFITLNGTSQEKKINLGKTADVKGYDVTIVKAYWKYRQSAILKIVPK